MIPLVTQPYFDGKLKPLGVVRAEICGDDIDRLDAAMRDAAPSGTVALYNYKYEHRSGARISSYMSGTADAWANPPRGRDTGPL